MKTVSDLIGYLSQYPPDWLVFDIDGMSICDPAGHTQVSEPAEGSGYMPGDQQQ